MNAVIEVHLTVEEILEQWPETISAFFAAQTKCPGCFMQQFCTLANVAEIYQIPMDVLLSKLQNSIQFNNHAKRSSQ